MSHYPQTPGQLPHNPPVVLPANVTQQFQQFIPLINGYAMMEVINSAQRTAIRQGYATLVTQNNWQNQDFQTLVHATGQLAEYLIATRRAQDPNAAIQAASQETVAMLAAVFASKYQSQFAQILANPDARNQINQLLGRFRQLDAEISNFYNSLNGPQPTPGYGGVPGMTGGGYQYSGAGAGMGYGATPYQPFGATPNPLLAGMSNTNTVPAGGSGSMFGSSGNTGASGVNVTAPGGALGLTAAAAGGSTPGRPAGLMEVLHMDKSTVVHGQTQPAALPTAESLKPLRPVSTTAPAASEPTARPVLKEVETMSPQAVATAPIETVAPVLEIQPLTVDESGPWYKLDPNVEFPKVRDLGRPWDAVLVSEDGTELRFPLTSGWRLSYNPDQPYLTAFDPAEYIRMYKRAPDGVITEEIIKRDSTMEYLEEYLENELDEKVRAGFIAHRDKDISVPVDMALISKLRPVENSPISIPAKAGEGQEDTEVVSDIPAVKLDTAIVVSDMKTAHNKLQLALKKNDIAFDDNVPFEYYVDMVTPIMVTGEDAKAIVKMGEALTFEELIDAMSKVGENEVANKLDERLTDTVNRLVKHNLGLRGWSIESFGEDYQALVTELAKDFGEDFATRFKDAAPAVVGAALQTSKTEEVTAYGMRVLGVTEADLEGTDYVVLNFVERNSVTILPWRLSELRVRLDTESNSLVPESSLPNLHTALSAIMARTEDVPYVHAHRFIVPREEADQTGTVLELYQGYLVDGSLLLGFSDIAADKL
jgi:hypothetical protein